MTFEAASGHRLGISGHGEPLSTRVAVLCHSAPGTGAIDPDPVASTASGLRIIGVDRPGYGASDRYDGEPDVDAWVTDVRDYLSRLDPISRRSAGVDIEVCGVVGVGYGAFFAAALAAAHPGCPRLVVLDPPVPPLRSEALDDPVLHGLGSVDPMTGAADRQQAALDEADSDGAAADHLVLADVGWAHRVRSARVTTDLVGVPDDPGTAWWRRHLHRPAAHDLAAGGLPGLAEGWRIALAALAAERD